MPERPSPQQGIGEGNAVEHLGEVRSNQAQAEASEGSTSLWPCFCAFGRWSSRPGG